MHSTADTVMRANVVIKHMLNIFGSAVFNQAGHLT